MKSKLVRGLLTAAALCATVAIGLLIVYATTQAQIEDAATAIMVTAALLAGTLAAAAGVVAFNRSSR